ncbi:hypothetical protein TPHA_0J02990 [Tetrapisispora phaffii CBS 4417]|uniref:HIT-type domain-containing protein n=1 Tax=Tetrapisispora phaffii (strain ATCC 24235 / CBS 4417 / NBRC 1672 / NRRL Y-8282 / UCD 70-5) TaxID=1071381 RepID=G8BY68_TETPH|nr:hypothetical protein TPHA_0J02990 [Tetrapisispora phaffii CBS 4417]CCE65119.1 hypothetical protein TPHA_0J02990 [Tetrapisispora phaffii CBS 4417]
MPSKLVEEINPRTYNPNVYFTSLNGTKGRQGVSKNIKSTTISSRNSKRVNYSLADMEAKLYTSNADEVTEDSTNHRDKKNSSNQSLPDKFSPADIIQSRKRFMELDTENKNDQYEVPGLLSTIFNINRDKIDSSGSNTRGKNKFDVPKNLKLSYKSTKPPATQKKPSHRLTALKRILSSKRTLQSYVEALDNVNRHIIFSNVYNKKYFKVLPFITICSICGGTDDLSGCINCGEKICSVSCFKLHNDTRCTM